MSTVVSMISGLVEAAKAAGRPGDDHVVVTLHGGSTEQITLTTSLDGLAAAVRSVKAPASDPVHVIIGAAAEQRHELSWYETKPLFGWRVLVPRTKDQAAPMVARLRTYGAHSEEVPTISSSLRAVRCRWTRRSAGWSRAVMSGWRSPRSTRSGPYGRSSRSTGWTLAPSPG